MPKKAAPEEPGRAESLPWQAAALLLLALIAYWNSLDGSFHFDDFVLFSDPDITGPGFGWAILRLGQTRPLTYLTFHWNYALGGADSAGYHWVNLFLHGLSQHLPRRALVVGVPVLIGALLLGTILRNRTWRDEKSLWADVMQKSPNKPRAYRNLARAYWADDLPYSRQLLERGLALDRNNAEMHSDMGITLMLQSEPKEALLHFQKAMISSGPNADLWNNIGAAHLRLGETSKAVESYGQALKLDPCSFASRKNLMQALSQTADRQAALAASQLPPNCRLTPEEAAKLEDLRRSLR